MTLSSAESLEILRDAGPEPVVTSTMVMITGGAQPAVNHRPAEDEIAASINLTAVRSLTVNTLTDGGMDT